MSRITVAASILRPLHPTSVLDVGCRDASLRQQLPDVEYFGADLVAGPHIKYVGDITKIEFDRTFDTVVALDILEHLEPLSATFDRLMAVSERRMLISLPNTYDLKSRFNFATKGRLNGKYTFTEEPPVDRHRWLMGREEIMSFAKAKARKHGVQLRLFDLTYGSSGARGIRPFVGRMLAKVFRRSLTTETVLALFTK